MPQQELSSGDIVRTAKKSRVELLNLSRTRLVGRKGHIRSLIRVGQESEFVVTTGNLILMGKSLDYAQVKKGSFYRNKRMPVAVAAIRG